MNSWLWQALVPEMLEREDDYRLVGVGSLLSCNLDLVPGRKVVFGTGSGYSSPPTPEQGKRWRVYCVRGPLTARLMGLEPELGITDGAWLINQVPDYAAVPTERRGTVFVPHWTSAKFGAWAAACKASDVTYVDPLWDCARVFHDIAHAELAVVESLHGAIIADYYRTPWIPVVSPSRILKFKWLDWCQSLGLDYAPFLLPPSDYVDCLIQRKPAGKVDTALSRLDVPADTYDVRETPPPPSKAGVVYFTKRRIKARLRKARNFGVDQLSHVRDSAVFRGWNERHRDRLAEYFKALQAQRPQLSDDTIRAEKIDRLNGALERMRSDFREGRL